MKSIQNYPMQRVLKPRRHQKRNSFYQRFLFLVVLSLITVMTLIALGGLRQEQATAFEVGTGQVTNLNYWQRGSFPVENFQAYTSPFGYRRSATGGRGTEFHRGLDIAAPEGSYIRSWWAGQVVALSDNTACGTSITIQSGDWKHVYCHMKGHVETGSGGRYLTDSAGGIQIWQGQQVSSGTRIGRVGMTGRTTGPHLHWGLKYNDQYINPALVLQAMYAQQPSSGSMSTYSHQRD